jgi:very-short-patch-repair endonuclease/predicted transcriptional regulator of viral defense system
VPARVAGRYPECHPTASATSAIAVGVPQPFGPRSSWDERISDLATAQHGVVSRRQLLEAGLSAAAVRHRVERHRLHVIHRGVYGVGHALLSPKGWWMAAVLAGGPGAVLSHRAAAALWGLVESAPSVADVLVLRSADRRRRFRPHRVRSIPSGDREVVDGIPCTSVARTLVDLASDCDEREIDRALRRAQDLRLFDRFELEAMLARARPGTTVLRTAMLVFAGDEATRRLLKSELELRFLELLRRHDFVLPSTNVTITTRWRDYEVDTLWPDHRLVIELDGWWAHLDRESFRRDHQRATDVRATGYDVVRLTWDQVVVHGEQTVERLKKIVPERSAPTSEGGATDR